MRSACSLDGGPFILWVPTSGFVSQGEVTAVSACFACHDVTHVTKDCLWRKQFKRGRRWKSIIAELDISLVIYSALLVYARARMSMVCRPIVKADRSHEDSRLEYQCLGKDGD